MKGPEKMLPTHIGGEMPPEGEGAKKDLTSQEKYEWRREKLREASDFDGILRKELKEKGIEPPGTLNLSLLAVEDFQRITKEAQALREVVRKAKEPAEKVAALSQYDAKKKEIQEYLDYGFSFEKAYREYIRERNEFTNFSFNFKKLRQLESALEEPAFKSISEDAKMSERSYSRLEKIARESESNEPKTRKEKESTLESLKSIYSEDSSEYKELAKKILSKEKSEKLPRTKKEIKEELNRLRNKVQEEWENPMVRYFWQRNRLDGILEAFAEGKDVIETESVIKHLNELHDWEKQHQRTTVGGILVGPPGTGKTTLIRHYLESKGRLEYKYIDLSEDVTRYMLYGSKNIEFKSPVEYYECLIKDLRGLDEAGFRKFIQENLPQVKSTFDLSEDEATVALIGQLEEELKRLGEEQGVTKSMATELSELRSKINTLAEKAHRKELAGEFAHIVKRNGWRDGVVIAALRQGQSIILDEFNKNKNWSLIYGLLTAKPGEKWYFADNDEWIKIPENWRMYFTANIGRKHGGFEVAEALASRGSGKISEIEYPPQKEEMEVALASLSDAEGNFLRTKDDLVKLYLLVNEVFPKIRNLIEDKRQSVSISFRTIRDLGEKLVLYREPKTKKSVYRATEKSFDEALYDVLVKSHSIYEDKKIPEEIVGMATSVGLFLDARIKEDVIKWIGKERYEERKEIFEKPENKKEFDEIVKKIRGTESDATEMPMPETKKY